MSKSTPGPVPGVNLALLAGTLSRPAELRTLPSGTLALELQLTIRLSEGPAESVPVTWLDPPANATTWAEGQAVVVVGRVRRRFFRAGGATASRTEVLAAAVVPSQRRAAVRKAIGPAMDGARSALVP